MSATKTVKPSPFTHTPTAEERKEQQDALKGKPIVVKTDETKRLLRNLFKKWGTTDVAFCCIHDTLMMSVFNNNEMREQMILWKDLAKRGKLEVLEENNTTLEFEGKEYHFLTITPTPNKTNFDPVGVAMGFLVNGYCYGFRRKENRDAVFKYIKKQTK